MTTTTTTTTPSSLSAPKPNGTTTATQAPASGATTPTLEQREAALKAREEALDKRDRVYRDEQRKAVDEKKGLGAKLSRLNELEKWKSEADSREKLRQLNPIAALEQDFGKDWREKVSALSVNGVPPVDLIAEAMQRLEQRFEQRLSERDAKTREELTRAEAAEVEEARAMAAHKSSRWYEANAKDFPVFERLGDIERVGQILGQRIEAHYMRTGELLTEQAAAEGLESELIGLVEHAVKADKYKSKLQPETKPANVSSSSGESVGVPGTQSGTRRTLDNSMTASASSRAPSRSDAEREARAIAAYNAVRAKGNA